MYSSQENYGILMAKKATQPVKHVLPLYLLYLRIHGFSYMTYKKIQYIARSLSPRWTISVDRARLPPKLVRTHRSSIPYRSAAISQSVERSSPEAAISATLYFIWETNFIFI